VLPILTVLFLPIVFGMHDLYEWTHPDVVAASEVLRHKQAYLNTPFFLVRAAFYFLAWNTVSYVLNAWGLEQDRTGDPRIARRMQMLSGGGLLLYGLTVTFAAFDWLMSIEPRWFSTIYGVLVIGGQGLSAMAFLIGVIVWLSRRPPLDELVTPAHLNDLGNLLLAFVMLWAYFSFSQYLIIWAGNLPEEISWYVHRLQTGWRAVGLTLVVFHFVVPFCLLLSRAIKRAGQGIIWVASLILLARLVDLFWLIAPEFHQQGVSVSWQDVVLPATLACLWLSAFVWQLRGRAILPVNDPQFDETIGRILERGVDRPSTVH
jgi:FtsH-binding integral membrane protein